MSRGIVAVILVLSCPMFAPAASQATFEDDFSAGASRWTHYFDQGHWVVEENAFRSTGGQENSARLANIEPVRDVVIQTRLQVLPGGRSNLGVVLRAQPDGSCLVVRYYDRARSLELLSGPPGSWRVEDLSSEPTPIEREQWYRLKVALVDDLLLAKLWPDAAPEPEWTFRRTVTRAEKGGVGLVAQDGSRVAFDDVTIWTSGGPVQEVQMLREKEAQERARRLRETLDLVVTVSPFTRPGAGGPVRLLEAATLAFEQCQPVAGTLHVTWGDQTRQFELSGGPAERGVAAVAIPEPDSRLTVRVVFEAAIGKRLERTVTIEPAVRMAWRDYVRNCLDVLIERGRDRYGPVHTDMLMAILDVYSHTSPENPPMLDDDIRTEGRPDHGRRSPGGSNLWLDQPTLGVMYRMSQLTGEAKYARAADAYIAATYKYASKPNHLIYMGSHSYYNAFTEKHGGDGIHETLIKHGQWEAMHRVDPERFQRYVDALWKWHIVDKQTGLHNRHDDGQPGCDFAFSGGTFATAFAYLAKASGQQHYLDKAKLVAGWHYENRNMATGLTADCPNLKRRYDGHHCFTTVSGPHAAALLRCYEITGEPYFRTAAITYIRAYDRYGWDADGKNYFGMLRLDGTPILEQLGQGSYDIWQPIGYVDVWRTTMYSYEMPLIAAQTTLYAARLCDDASDKADMLRAARHWAHVIEQALPARSGRRWARQLEEALPRVSETGGTYAENYGRAISFFVGLYQEDGNEHYLKLAESLAREAVEKLYVNGLFRGHPAKDFYQANDGVGLLLHALLQLDALPERWRLAF